MCKSSAGPGRNNTIWKLSVSALCQPATRYTPTPLFYWKTSPLEPQWLPVSQTAHRWPLQARKLSSSQGAKEPRGLDFFPFFSPLPTLRWLCWLLAQAWERRVERHGERAAKTERERRRESAQVCIFNLIAPSLHFAPRFKKPTYSSSSSSGLFSKMTRISPELMFSRWQDGSHEPCSRQPCVLTVDFESELRSIWFFCLF